MFGVIQNGEIGHWIFSWLYFLHSRFALRRWSYITREIGKLTQYKLRRLSTTIDRIIDRARLFTNCGYGLEEFWKEEVSWNLKFSRFSLRIFDDILLRGYVKCWESRRARYRDKRFANEPVRDEKCWNIIQCSTHGQLHSRFRWHAQTPAVCAAQWNLDF